MQVANETMMNDTGEGKWTICLADNHDREIIYRLRHDIYASEIKQHSENSQKMISDTLDSFNTFIVVRIKNEIAGFVSLTPPGLGYSVDKYFSRSECPVSFDDALYEIRLLTVVKLHRGSFLASLLMYAAFRWIEERGGRSIVAIGRDEMMSLYTKVGMRPSGKKAQSGKVCYELMTVDVVELKAHIGKFIPVIRKLQPSLDWKLDIPYEKRPAPCYHGGVSFKAIGEEFDRLEFKAEIINADVLDAWFEPAPSVQEVLRAHLGWALRTSPPTQSEGLVRIISKVRNIPLQSILVGAGSSALIYLCFGRWLDKHSKVLIMDPSYGEYIHYFEKVIECKVDRFLIKREENYQVRSMEFLSIARRGYDLIVIVNPANPTGQHIPKEQMEFILNEIPSTTKVWIDEAYLEYVGAHESLESYAAASHNVVVCKSMSKVLGLSGARVAYLCGPSAIVDDLKRFSPPWAVSLVGQIAGVEALKAPDYYQERYQETRVLRSELITQISNRLPWEITDGVANFFLCHLPPNGPDARTLTKKCQEKNLFIRNIGNMGANLNNMVIRIAVKDGQTNGKMSEILSGVWESLS